MLWGIAFAVLLVALLIPVFAILRDAPAFRRPADRQLPPRDDPALAADRLARRLQLLEDEVDDLARSVEQLRDDTQFLQQLLENPDRRDAPRPPGTSD